MPKNKQDCIAWTAERTKVLSGLLEDRVKQTGECKLNKTVYETWAAYLTTKFNFPVMPTQIKHKKENLQKEWEFLKTLDGATGLWVNLESGEFDFSTEYRHELIKTNPRAPKYLSKDVYPSFKTLGAIFARSTASGSLAFGTASSHALILETQLSEDKDHNGTAGDEEHRIDDMVNDVRSRLNRLHAMSSNGVRGISGSSQSIGKGKRKKKDTTEGEDWLKVIAQTYVESKTKPMSQFAKCISILTNMGYTGRDKIRLQMVLKDDIGLQTMLLENNNDADRRLIIDEYMSK